MKTHYKNILFCLAIVFFGRVIGHGQYKPITLSEALRKVQFEHPDLERDRLKIKVFSTLATAGLPAEFMQIYFSAEEFNFKDQNGIKSLSIQQNFNLPKASKVHRDYYKQHTVLAEKQLLLTASGLKLEVERAFYQLIYSKELLNLANENENLYQNFVSATQVQLANGETGRIPHLAALTRLGQAQLEKQKAENYFQSSLKLFNHWMPSDTLFDASGNFSIPDTNILNFNKKESPHLQMLQAHKDLATVKIETEKAQLIPQLNTGLKLQSSSGNFPLYAYQLGLNIPLIRKSYRKKIEVAQLEVLIQDAELKSEQLRLQRSLGELIDQAKHQQSVLNHLQEQLMPVVKEQAQLSLAAYREGELGYLEYLDSLEQLIKVRQNYLQAVYKLNAAKLELNFWKGQ